MLQGGPRGFNGYRKISAAFKVALMTSHVVSKGSRGSQGSFRGSKGVPGGSGAFSGCFKEFSEDFRRVLKSLQVHFWWFRRVLSELHEVRDIKRVLNGFPKRYIGLQGRFRMFRKVSGALFS